MVLNENKNQKNMKKIYIVACLALLTGNTFAQIMVGPKVGVNFSQINYGEDYDQRFDSFDQPFQNGFQAGLAFDFQNSHFFSLYSELLYTQKGSKYDASSNESGTVNYFIEERRDLTLNYIEVPLLARLKIGGNSQFYVNAGPTASYWLNGKIKQTTIINGISSSTEGAVTFKDEDEITGTEDGIVFAREDVNRFDIGAAIGAGALVDFVEGKFNIDVRYTVGFTSVYESSGDLKDSWKNNVLSVSVGYFLE